MATGGTLASLADQRLEEHYSSASVPIEQLINELPELHQTVDVVSEQVVQVLSYSLSHDVWLKIAKRVEYWLNEQNFDGVVICHGTDAMEETAYFLNLVVCTDKPIVFTGAMRPANALGSDGLRNLYNAVMLAASDQSRGKGVLITLNDVIHNARDVTKTNVHTPDSFKSPELGLLGYLQGGRPYFYRSPVHRHTYLSEFNLQELSGFPRVQIVYGYIGQERSMVDALISSQVDGIVSAGLGKGHQTDDVMQALIEARRKGIAIARSTRVENGIVTRDPQIDDQYDWIAASNLNPQKSRILLMLALTKMKKSVDLQRVFDEY